MGFFEEDFTEEERPRRRTRRGIGDSDKLDWQDIVDEVEEPEEEDDGDTIQELEIDEHGRMRRSSRDEESDFWEQEDE